MVATRTDGAPPGTPFKCYVCGYDTRWTPNSDKNDGKGVYEKGIGVRHETTRDCMKVMNHFLDHRLYLDRPHHRKDLT